MSNRCGIVLPKGILDVHSSSYRPYLWMVLGCASFAWMAVLAHAAGERCNWQTVAFFRSFFVLIFVAALCLATKTPLVFFRPKQLWLRSLAGSLSLVATFYALAKLKASTVVTLTNTFPIWVAILSWPMLRVLPSPRVWLAVVGGVIGVYLIQQPHEGGDSIAFFVALTGAISTSIAMIGLHKLKGVNSNAVVVHFSAVATLICVIAYFLFEGRDDALPFYDPIAIALLLGVGLSASIGQMCLTRAFARGDPSKVAVVGLSQVVFTLIIDIILNGHRLNTEAFLGTFLILAPTAWVMIERRQPAPKSSAPKDPLTVDITKG
jgi:drug/metabolite transporter (DMT)-like permease